jgi:hypothetical protein
MDPLRVGCDLDVSDAATNGLNASLNLFRQAAAGQQCPNDDYVDDFIQFENDFLHLRTEPRTPLHWLKWTTQISVQRSLIASRYRRVPRRDSRGSGIAREEALVEQAD